MDPTCSICLHWKRTTPLEAKITPLGMCLRYPPQIIATGWPLREFSHWPVTQSTATCGEYVNAEQFYGDRRDEQPLAESDQENAPGNSAEEPQEVQAPAGQTIPEPSTVTLEPVEGLMTTAIFSEGFSLGELLICGTERVELTGDAIPCFIEKMFTDDQSQAIGSLIEQIKRSSKVIGIRARATAENPTRYGRIWAWE